ncbi:MAG: type II toxin-antitoxin system PemK/MazF family toxin [Bifidobacteriaceae bacterium]|jgi:mRNA interferase MazF|nr:type II toxin-antitoxin system PemK/MazF family toxin [Bifidobacteriaceae bacterium]
MADAIVASDQPSEVGVPLSPGDVVWAALDPARGREQAGHRPALVVASGGYLDAVTMLAIVLPVTTVDRGWPNHIRLSGPSVGLAEPSWAMTEQPRTIVRGRITARAGRVDADCLAQARQWLADFFDL